MLSGHERIHSFKNSSDKQVDELRRKRGDAAVEIRKQKKLQNLSKRRNLTGKEDDILSDSEENWTAMVRDVLNDNTDENVTLQATIYFRKALSKENNPPIDQVIKSKLIPRFIHFLRSPNADLQFEAAWVITNVCSGSSDQTEFIIENGGVEEFVRLLGPDIHHKVRDQAVWALGNIAGDSVTSRDLAINAGALNPILKMIDESLTLKTAIDKSYIRNAVWTLSNLFRGKKSTVNAETLATAVPILVELLYSPLCEDHIILADTLWCFSYITISNIGIKAVLDSGCAGFLIELLHRDSFQIISPALRTLGNICTGDDAQTQHLIDLKILPALVHVLKSKESILRKEVCWTLSNITAGVIEQIRAVIDSNIIPLLIDIMQKDTFEVKKEACWALANCTQINSTEAPDIIKFLVKQGVVLPFCELLRAGDANITSVILDALENILRIGESEDSIEMVAAIDIAEGTDIICELQDHENSTISEKAYNIMTNYLGEYEEDDNEEYLNEDGKFDFSSTAQPIGVGEHIRFD
ncbi:Importin alpha subunit (Karyopherin alpha subunit) (Serine-rich RNA polymerase I suppressor protein) [Lobulomyces angularis]|nr:Importin alpha subunit (Karyopherin alpha subunit) (Serine-rich RNA polymerase I suppressor protein) [Lobulomyces angularis]